VCRRGCLCAGGVAWDLGEMVDVGRDVLTQSMGIGLSIFGYAMML